MYATHCNGKLCLQAQSTERYGTGPQGLLGIQATSIVCEAGMKISTAAADF